MNNDEMTANEPHDFIVNVGQYFSRGWEIFSQYAWGFIGFFIITIIISGIASTLPGPLGVGEDGKGTGIINTILSPILSAGIYSWVANCQKQTQKIQ